MSRYTDAYMYVYMYTRGHLYTCTSQASYVCMYLLAYLTTINQQPYT